MIAEPDTLTPASPVSDRPDLPPIKGEAVGPQDWRTWFAASYVVNLDRRPDRLRAFLRDLPADWPLPPVQRVAAVDGAQLAIPNGWRATPGAYGLHLTYRRIVQEAIDAGCDRPILLLEDDALFVPDFARRFSAVMANVPEDFDGVWIGGQHRGRRIPYGGGLVRATDLHRTHAWIAHPRFFAPLLAIWDAHQGHVDQAIAACCSRFKIFAMEPFLAAQRGGASDISNRKKPLECWDTRTRDMLGA